jgi:branched-chain amino acid aminotransferase
LEAFGTGTAATVTPIGSIFYENKQLAIKIPTLEQKDPLYKKLFKSISDIQRGRVSHDWAYPIPKI